MQLCGRGGAGWAMAEVGSSVTLIFYKLRPDWWSEAGLNLIAAMAQMSSFTHVEVALGQKQDRGYHEKCVQSVQRFVGAEVTSRTGKNPLRHSPPLTLRLH